MPTTHTEAHLTRRQLGVVGSRLIVLMVLCIGGCGKAQQTAKPVDSEEARQTLQAVLADWAQGGKPEAWRQKSPEVIVQDHDWSSGTKLRAFEILGPGETRDANLFCQVKLRLANSPPHRSEQIVTYCVGTDPLLTVFRAMNP